MINTLSENYPELSRGCVQSRVIRARKNFKESAASVVMNNVDSDFVLSNKDVSTKPITKSVEFRSDGSAIFERIIALTADEQLTPAKVLQAHGMDPGIWEIISCKSNFYQQQKRGGTILNLYQSKITAKPIADGISIEDVQKHFENYNPKYRPSGVASRRTTDGKYLYEINIADLHLGRFANMRETGEPLDINITKRRFLEIIDKECENIEKLGDNVEKILFVWSNDFFNSDGISGATTAGTPQDTDTKWQSLYEIGCEMLIDAIHILRCYAPVKTFYVASNHSRQSDFYAICNIKSWFKDCYDVEVDTKPAVRHYERYGVNLIGFSHSYYEKKATLPHLMSVECPEDWGETSYREFHLAHYHSEKVEEVGGVIFRWLPSVTGPDSWSNECGYVGAVKRSYSFVYDKEKGMIQMNSTIVD